MRRRRFQLSLRSLLVVTTLLGIALAIWCGHPSPLVKVKVTSTGSAIVNEREVPVSSLDEALEHEHQTRKRWLVDCTVELNADSMVAVADIQNIIANCRDAGFEKFVLRAD